MLAPVHLIRVPYDSAARGARMGAGPDRLAALGAADCLRAGGREVVEAVVEAPEGFRAEIGTGFALLRALAERARAARAAGAVPLVLAGNCSTAVATVSGVRAADGGPVGVVWFDAHADFETPETTTTGFLDGTGLATLVGRCWRALAASVPGFAPVPPAHVVLVGARDVSDAERAALADAGVTWVRLGALQDAGAAALAPALDALSAAGVRRAYVHVDLDTHDPRDAPANGYQPPGGLTPAAVRDAVRLVVERFEVAAAAITAYDPACDPDGRAAAVALELAPVLVGSAAHSPGAR
jgi:arginase